jgi:hypothetical protein
VDYFRELQNKYNPHNKTAKLIQDSPTTGWIKSITFDHKNKKGEKATGKPELQCQIMWYCSNYKEKIIPDCEYPKIIEPVGSPQYFVTILGMPRWCWVVNMKGPS